MTIRRSTRRPASTAATELGLPTQHGVRMAELVHDMAPRRPTWSLVGYRTLEQFARGRRLDRRPGHPGREPLQLVPDAALRRHRPARPGRSTRPPRPACCGSTRRATTPSATGAATAAAGGTRHPDRARPPGRPCCCSLAWASPAVTRERRPSSAQDAAGRLGRGAAQHARRRPTNARTTPLDRRRRRLPRWSCARSPARRPTLDLFSRDRRLRRRWRSPRAASPRPATPPARLTVGAVKWTGTALEPYSSQGPPRGRAKPDLVGPTYVTSNPEWPGTAGTSAADRRTSRAPRCCCARQRLAAGLPAGAGRPARARWPPARSTSAPPGPDPLYGAGHGARSTPRAPRLAVRVAPGAAPGRAGARADAGTIRHVRISLNGRPPAGWSGGRWWACACPPCAAARNRVVVTAEDMAGNVAVAHPRPAGPPAEPPRRRPRPLGARGAPRSPPAAPRGRRGRPAALTVDARPGQVAHGRRRACGAAA